MAHRFDKVCAIFWSFFTTVEFEPIFYHYLPHENCDFVDTDGKFDPYSFSFRFSRFFVRFDVTLFLGG